ncbi:hypothetical protein F5Y03DRAFT_399117 [Xylaria venustula]|nr:hypothetical protein F5Y03DRAFT_399117 [Xylaria venustula]
MPYLRGEPLVTLLDAVQNNIPYLKLVFDEDEEHPELGDAEVCQQLAQRLQRLVDNQVHCLFINEWNGPRFVRHRLNIFNRIWARFGDSDRSRERWARLLPQAHGGTVDSDNRTISELVAALPPPEEVETRLRSLLALAEECAEEGTATAPPRPDMRALRLELDRIAAEELRRMWTLQMTTRIIRRNITPAPRRRVWTTWREERSPPIRRQCFNIYTNTRGQRGNDCRIKSPARREKSTTIAKLGVREEEHRVLEQDTIRVLHRITDIST